GGSVARTSDRKRTLCLPVAPREAIRNQGSHPERQLQAETAGSRSDPATLANPLVTQVAGIILSGVGPARARHSRERRPTATRGWLVRSHRFRSDTRTRRI